MNLFRFIIPKSSVEYISYTSTVRQAYEKMRYHNYVAIPVLDDAGKYVGTVSNDDLFRYFLESGRTDMKRAETRAVMDILKKDYQKPLDHTASMESLIESVREHNFVSVVDDRGCFIGIILRRDVLNFLFDHYKKHKRED